MKNPTLSRQNGGNLQIPETWLILIEIIGVPNVEPKKKDMPMPLVEELSHWKLRSGLS